MSSTNVDDYTSTGQADVTAYISTIFTMVFLSCCYLVWKFAETGFPKMTYITCIYGYFCTFALLLIVPIDLAAVLIDRRNNNETEYSRNFHDLVGSYNSVFIPILILSNLVLVFEEYYNTDGYFTVFMKLISAFKRMMIDMFAMLVAGCIILGILIGTHVTSGNSSALQLSAVIVTNTVYETMLMFLLAYGLAQFPQKLWYSADLNHSLLQAQQRASTSFKRLGDASLDISLVVSDVMKTKKHLEQQNDNSLADAMKVLLSDVPDGFTSSTMGKVAANKKGKVTLDTLAELRTRLCVKKDTYRMALGGVEGVKFRAYTLEDIVAATTRTDGKESIYWSLYAKESSRVEWLWHLKIRPMLRKIGAILAFAVAIFMLMGVMGSINGASSSISLYYHIVHSDSATAGGIVIFVLFTLGYTAYITLWSLLQVKVAGLMELVPGQTTPQSMSFNVRMCMRLTPPLAFFYLGWLSENGVNSTGNFLKSANGLYDMPLGFTKIYEIGKVEILRKFFGTVFPVLLFCLVFVFLFNLWNRLAVYMKLGDYQFGAELVAEDVLREGKRQLSRYKKHMERKCQRKEFKGKLDSAGATLAGEKPPLLHRIIAYFTATPQTTKANDDGDEETGDGDMSVTSNPAFKLKMPVVLSGNLERKGDKKMMGGSGWRVGFAAVVAPGTLKFFKEAVTMNADGEVDPSSMKGNSEIFPAVNLTLVLSVGSVEKKKKTDAFLNLELGDETVNLRFKTIEEMELWKSGLRKWKDYAVAYSNAYGSSGSGPRSSASVSKPKRKTMDEFDKIGTEDGDEDDASLDATGGEPLIAKTSSKKSPKKFVPQHVEDEKPVQLRGYLEKKSSKKIFGAGGDWQKRYCLVDETSHSLVYYKGEDTSDKPQGSIDLLMVVDITPYDKEGSGTSSTADACRFTIDMGDNAKSYKFRCESPQQAETWMNGLQEWREWCLLNMTR